MVKSINAGDKKKAAKQFMNFSKPPEIKGRRRKEQKLFAEGIYSNEGKARLCPATKGGTVQFGKCKVIDLEKELGKK